MGIQGFLSLSIIIIFMFILYNIAKNNNTEQSSKNASEKAEESKSNNLDNLTHAEKAEMYVKNKNYQKAYDEYLLAKNKDEKNANFYDKRMDYCLKMLYIADYSQLIKRNPYEMIYYRKRRNLYMQVEDYQNALNDSNSIINYNGGITYDLRTRAEIYIKLKQYISAIEDYEKLITSGSDKSFDIDQIILCRYLMQLEEYDKAIELNPNNADYYEKRAKLFVQNEEYLKAIEDYNKLIELNPEKISSYQDEITNCENKCSIPEYNVLIEKDPNNVSYYEKRAEIYIDQGKYDKAIADYSNAIELNPERAWYCAKYYAKRAEIYIELKEYNKAIFDYSEAIELNPGDAGRYRSRANVYVELKEYNKAISDYSKFIEIYPKNYDAYCKRASVWIELGKIEEAKIDLRKAKKYVKDTEKEAQIQRTIDSLKNVKSKTSSTPTKNTETKSKTTSKDKKQVTVTLQHPDVKENNVKADEYIENANKYEIKKDYINAINEYTKAIELKPDNVAEIYVYRAQCCMEFGQYSNVIEDCTNAIEKTKMYNSTAYYTRGLAYEKLNLLDKAKEDYKQALSIKPDDKIYQEAYNKLLQTNSIIDLANCTKEEIQSLNGFNEEKAQRFIEEKNNGKMWYDIDSFVQDFELQPHEMVLIQDRIKFPDKPKSKYGRKIDV